MNNDSPIRQLVCLRSPVQQEQPPPLQAILPKVKAKHKCGLCGACGHHPCHCPHKLQGDEMMLIFQTMCNQTAKNLIYPLFAIFFFQTATLLFRKQQITLILVHQLPLVTLFSLIFWVPMTSLIQT
jgi:hypothetical protein